MYSMTMDAMYKERGSDWSHQVSAVGTTHCSQRDQTLPLCEGCGLRDYGYMQFLLISLSVVRQSVFFFLHKKCQSTIPAYSWLVSRGQTLPRGRVWPRETKSLWTATSPFKFSTYLPQSSDTVAIPTAALGTQL